MPQNQNAVVNESFAPGKEANSEMKKRPGWHSREHLRMANKIHRLGYSNGRHLSNTSTAHKAQIQIQILNHLLRILSVSFFHFTRFHLKNWFHLNCRLEGAWCSREWCLRSIHQTTEIYWCIRCSWAWRLN